LFLGFVIVVKSTGYGIERKLTVTSGADYSKRGGGNYIRGDNSHIEGWQEVAKKAKMYRKGMSVGDARKKLEKLIGPDRRVLLKNHNDGDEAWLSMTSVKKLTAGDTVDRSVGNGFTAEQHFAVVSDIDNLYKNAVKVLSYPDVYGNKNVSIHRLAVSLHFNNAVAYITVKESTEAGKRVHSTELMEIKKLGGILADARRVSRPQPRSELSLEGGGNLTGAGNPSYDPSSAPRLYTNNIRKLRENVNSKSEKNKKTFSGDENSNGDDGTAQRA
jgi:hypothetical protein